jgi:2-methylcitrate dehydratase PrpD
MKVVAETFAGARHEVHVAYPKGHPENPFLDAEVEEKFLRLAEPSLGKTRCQKFIDWARWLEKTENIGELFRCWQSLDRLKRANYGRL